MKTLTAALLIACGAVACEAAGPSSLPRSSPEAQGIASGAILEFVEAADREIDALHSLMVVRHGQVVAEGWWAPYGADTPHSLYSLSKSFTSTAVGLAIEEGKLNLHDRVLDAFPDDAPDEPSANLKAMRVKDLLRMSAGHESEVGFGPDDVWTKEFLAHPVPFKPGAHFMYNTPATYMLSAMVQEATGSTVLDYLRPRLFDPLGIEDPTWGTSPQGVSLGGYGLSIRTEDIAKFGQLYLQKGRWEGKPLVPESWVEAATSLQTSNGSNPESDWEQGYGFQFWRCRHGAFRGDGAFGQYCIVLPEQDAVIAITSGVRDMQAVLNLVWDHLLPAMAPAALPENEAARERLGRRLEGLKLPTVEGTGGSGKLDEVAGITYNFPENDRKLESIALEREGDDVVLVIKADGEVHRVRCGRGEWHKGRVALGGAPAQPVAASGAWTEDSTYTARLCLFETPFLSTLRLTFDGGELRLDSEANVAFGPREQPQLVGKAE